jgi:hypothetical protein
VGVVGHGSREWVPLVSPLAAALLSPSAARHRRDDRAMARSGPHLWRPQDEGTCRDIRKRRQAWWTLVRQAGVEPTNNAAERAIGPGVRWRKGSFGTHSPEGSRFVAAMMTVSLHASSSIAMSSTL